MKRATALPLLIVAACSGVSLVGCAERQDHGGPAPAAHFVDVAKEVGLDFVHVNGMSGEFFISEVMGPGGALVDYDNDGDLDVYVVQGRELGPGMARAETRHGDRLFRNRLAEDGVLRFVDVTAASGIVSRGYGMGVAAGDYDGDGWIDLYVTNFGPNLMLRNNGDGTFADVTAHSRAEDDRWSTGAAFVDFDADGRVDLFVTNYVDFSFANHQACFTATSARDYCGPQSFRPYPDHLFRNRGDGTFEDVTAASGIAGAYGAGLGIIPGDLNQDGQVDLFVANDGGANQLWINQGDGTFEDHALLAGCAFNVDGKPEASMGVALGDYDDDGDDDLFVSHLTDETNTLYVNDGTGIFDDATRESGLGGPSRRFTGFGAGWFDYNGDGQLDLLVVNGAVKTLADLERTGDPFPLHQRNQLFHNRGDGGFVELTDRAGPAFDRSEVSRGAAFGDVDNDGDPDVLVLNNNGPVRLLLNGSGPPRHWLGIRLADAQQRFNVVGASVLVTLADGSVVRRSARAAGSYLSSNDPRVLVGLGDAESVRSVTVRWADGTSESWPDPELDRYVTLTQGQGRTVAP